MIGARRRAILTIGLAFTMLIVASTPASGGSIHNWTVTTLHSIPGNGYYFSYYGLASDIAFDSKGQPHVVIVLSRGYWSLVEYGTIIDGSWEFSEIWNGSAESPSIAVGPGDTPSIVFFDDGPETVNYATIRDGVWNVTQVGNRDWYSGGGSWLSVRTAMAMNDAGSVYIVQHVYDENSTLKIISNENGTWGQELIESAVHVSIPTIAIGHDGSLHVVYNQYPSGGLVHAWRTNGVWSNETLDFGNKTNSWTQALAVDALGRVHICYADELSDEYHRPTMSTVIHAMKDHGEWTHEAVNTSIYGISPAIEVDGDGVAHVAYYDAENKDLVCANNAGGSWSSERVDQVDRVGSYPSIGIDPAGDVGIVYLNETGFTYKYAVSTQGSPGQGTPRTIPLAVSATIVIGTAAVALLVGYLAGRKLRPAGGQPANPPPPQAPQ